MPDQEHPSRDEPATAATDLERAGAFRTMVDNAFVGHVIADSDGILRYVNRHFAETCGYLPEELIGQHISLVHTPEQAEVSKAIIKAATRDGRSRPQEHWYLHRDGTTFPLLVACAALKSDAGALLTSLTAVDLAEAGRAQVAYQTLFDEMLDGFAHHEIICDESGAPIDYRYLAANPAFEAMTGINAKEVIGRTVREALPGVEQRWIDNFGRVAITGVPERFEDYVETLDKYFEVTAFSPAAGEFACLFQDITERRKFEEALRRSEEDLRRTQLSVRLGNWTWDATTDAVTWSETMFELFGLDPASTVPTLAEHAALLTPSSYEQLIEAVTEAMATGTPYELDLETSRSDDGPRWLRARVEPVTDAEGVRTGLWGSAQDISERKRSEQERLHLEARLARSQRLESVGRLAGSVAHDFNNMLTVILGHCDQRLAILSPDDPVREDLEQIRNAANRSADLTRQLLAFARNQPASPSTIDLNEAVADVLSMLRRLVGENIELTWRPGEDLGSIRIDPSQVGQILANLCVNARDAITGAGTITVETDNASFDEEYCAQHPEYLVGDYVQLAVTDTGSGMDAETLAQIFEPFFTTKELGQGTGLGLATVYGIARQNEGFVGAYSEPDFGTTIRVYLPRQDAPHDGARAVSPAATNDASDQQATILLVEDEEAILTLATKWLAARGHAVMAANSPTEALRLAEEHPEPIDLLVTDVIMPEMNGQELADRLKSTRPDLKVLFMSGYTSNVVKDFDMGSEDTHFIVKPFHLRELGKKVHEALDA